MAVDDRPPELEGMPILERRAQALWHSLNRAERVCVTQLFYDLLFMRREDIETRRVRKVLPSGPGTVIYMDVPEGGFVVFQGDDNFVAIITFAYRIAESMQTLPPINSIVL